MYHGCLINAEMKSGSLLFMEPVGKKSDLNAKKLVCMGEKGVYFTIMT